MDIVYQQAIALGFVFVEKFFFCMIPIYSKKFRRNKLLISLTSAFTAGIFLSAGITQLLPEADSFFNKDMSRRESRLMRKQMQIEGVSLNQGLSNEEKDFPWVHVIAGISFSMVLFLSRVIMTGGHHDDDDESEEEETNYMQADKATEDREKKEVEVQSQEKTQAVTTQSALTVVNHGPVRSPFAVIISLSIESFFSGLGIGVINEPAAMWAFFLAVALHEWAEALAVGVSFFKNNYTKRKAHLVGGIFSLDVAIGGTIGIIAGDQGNKVRGILIAISAGTFIFQSATEIIGEEFEDGKWKYRKYISYALGFGFMIFVYFAERWLE